MYLSHLDAWRSVARGNDARACHQHGDRAPTSAERDEH